MPFDNHYEECESKSISGSIGGIMPALSTRASEIEKLVEVAKSCGFEANQSLFRSLLSIVYLGDDSALAYMEKEEID